MYYNRIALKQRAKRQTRLGNPAVFLVTLVYILATTWVSNVADLIVPNPFNAMADVFNSWAVTLENMEYVSQGALDAMTQQLWASLRGPQAMIGLLVALIIVFYSLVVNLGYYGYTLQIMRGQGGGYGDLFSRFYLAGKMILLQVLKILFIYLWSLLFFFPGIVAAYRYRLAEYCLLDDPDISALEAIRRSKALMRGRKMDLFITDLSFIGWMFLEVLAFEVIYTPVAMLTGVDALATLLGLAAQTAVAVFVLSYQQLTYAGFYLFTLGNQAPPVDQASGFDPNGRPRNPFDNGANGPTSGFDRNPWDVGGGSDNNEGWNQ